MIKREHRMFTGICVEKKQGESIEKLIKRFRKKVLKSGILKTVVERMHFEKPSDRRRKEKMRAKRKYAALKIEQKILEEKEKKYDNR